VLNACQVARQGWHLTSAGGFADAFLRAGAGGFVGTLWAVGDAPARTFTETFYHALMAGKTFAESAIAARQAARDAGDATWLAYAVYGHPHAIVHFDAHPGITEGETREEEMPALQ
jgi:CHAT domain-containing protein